MLSSEAGLFSGCLWCLSSTFIQKLIATMEKQGTFTAERFIPSFLGI